MVFIAVPALRKKQRDTQRKYDTETIIGAVMEYRSHNSGHNPPSSTVVSTMSYDDPDDPRSGMGEWQTMSGSGSLAPYLIDFEPGGLTTDVSIINVFDQPGGGLSGLAFTFEGEPSNVFVAFGAQCVDESEMPDNYYAPEITNIPNDAIVFRYLEAGHWYCRSF